MVESDNINLRLSVFSEVGVKMVSGLPEEQERKDDKVVRRKDNFVDQSIGHSS